MTAQDRAASRDMPADFFGPLFGRLKLDTKAERAGTEAEWILSQLPAAPAILDLGCGRGRLSLALCARGATVSGLDINAEYLDIAKERAGSLCLTVDWRLGDERKLDIVNEFDAVVSAFTSFGYHTDDENEDVVRRVTRALRPGGLLFLEILNRDAPGMLEDSASVEDVGAGIRIVKEYTYDWATGKRTITFTYLENGCVSDGGSLAVRMYSLHEILHLLGRCGLSTISVNEHLRGGSFRPTSEHIALVARKEARQGAR